MADYKTYLATSILTEDKIVCIYENDLEQALTEARLPTASSVAPSKSTSMPRRSKNRAFPSPYTPLKSPRMLYDFHRSQNAKKPGTIHATYLLSGTKRSEEPVATNGGARNDGEDDYMQSSPFMGSSMPQIDHGTGASGVLSITLVKEQDLEG